MSVVSFLRDTASQFTTGALKSINNIVDFFSSLSSSVIGLFNSSTPFRQSSMKSEFYSSEYDIASYCHSMDKGKTNSLSSLKCFLDSKCKKDNLDDHADHADHAEIYEKSLTLVKGFKYSKGENNSVIDNNIQSEVTGTSITDDLNYHTYDKINYDGLDLISEIKKFMSEDNSVTVDNIQSEVTGASITDDPNFHIYDKINYADLDFIRNVNEFEDEKNSVVINPMYGKFDVIDEEIYSVPYSEKSGKGKNDNITDFNSVEVNPIYSDVVDAIELTDEEIYSVPYCEKIGKGKNDNIIDSFSSESKRKISTKFKTI